jgi:hypothetical protein
VKAAEVSINLAVRLDMSSLRSLAAELVELADRLDPPNYDGVQDAVAVLDDDEAMTDEDRHGPWDKEQQRYEDGCKEDLPHEALA